jgi:hypothetical protein
MSRMDIKGKTCDIRAWKKRLFFGISSTKLSHGFTSASKPATWKSFDCCLSHFRTPISTSSVFSETFATKMTKQMEVTRGQVRALRRMFEKFQLQFLNSLLGCSGCMGSGIVMMKQCPSCQLSWTFSANCIPKLQQNFTIRCRIHMSTTLLRMG